MIRTASVDAACEHGELEIWACDYEAESLVVVVGVRVPARGLGINY